MPRLDNLREPAHAWSTDVALALVPARSLYPRESSRLSQP